MRNFIFSLLVLGLLSPLDNNSFGDEIAAPVSSGLSLLSPVSESSKNGGLKFRNQNYFTGSLTTKRSDEGLRIEYSSDLSTEPKSDLVDCTQNAQSEIGGDAVSKVTGVYPAIGCASTGNKTDLFSRDNCNLIKVCAQSKLSAEKMTSLVYFTPARMAAEDMASLLLKDELPKMEKLEALIKFSNKKYGEGFSKTCSSAFEITPSDVCNKNLVLTGFSSLNDSCKTSQNRCYDLGDSSIVQDNDGVLEKYFVQRAETNVTNALSNDAEFINEVANIFSSTNSDPKSKVSTVIALMKKLSEENKLDPVFSFDTDFFNPKDTINSASFKFFTELASKKTSHKSAQAEIEKYRQAHARKILSETCPKKIGLGEICKRVTEIGNGKMGNYPDVAKATQHFKDLDSSHLSFLISLFPRGIKSDEDAAAVLNAFRCVALGVIPNFLDDRFGSGAGRLSMTSARDSWGLPNETTDAPFPIVRRELSVIPEIAQSSIIPSNATDFSQVPNPNLAEATTTEHNAINSSNIGGSIPETQHVNTFPTTTETTGFDKADKNPDQKLDAVVPSQTRTRISELEGEIAKAQARLDALNSTPSAQGGNDESLKREILNNQTTIDALRSEVSQLKRTIADTGSNPNEETLTRPVGARAGVSRAPAFVGVPEAVEETPTGPSFKSRTTSGPISPEAASASGMSEPNSRAPSSTTLANTSGRPLLTKTADMTSEKFDESIDNKILELKGEPFIVEENGQKFEIIPEMKEGKILLDEKGRPKFIRKKKEGKLSIKEAAPKRIEDKADLKRLDEKGGDRIRYMKLKKLTDGILQQNPDLDKKDR